MAGSPTRTSSSSRSAFALSPKRPRLRRARGSGQKYVLANYTWDPVLDVMEPSLARFVQGVKRERPLRRRRATSWWRCRRCASEVQPVSSSSGDVVEVLSPDRPLGCTAAPDSPAAPRVSGRVTASSFDEVVLRLERVRPLGPRAEALWRVRDPYGARARRGFPRDHAPFDASSPIPGGMPPGDGRSASRAPRSSSQTTPTDPPLPRWIQPWVAVHRRGPRLPHERAALTTGPRTSRRRCGACPDAGSASKRRQLGAGEPFVGRRAARVRASAVRALAIAQDFGKTRGE